MMNKIYLNNSKGEKSATVTVFMVTSAIALVKFAISGFVVFGYNMPVFPASELAIALVAAGGVYVLNKKKADNGNN